MFYFKSKFFPPFILILILLNCAIFKKKENEYVSIFNDDTYYNIEPYKFENYRWNEQSKKENKLYLKGLVDYFFEEEYRKALETFEDCIEIYPDDVRPYIRIIECYARLNQNKLALDMIDKAVSRFEPLLRDRQLIYYENELKSGKTINDVRAQKGKIVKILLFLPNQLWKLIKLLPLI